MGRKNDSTFAHSEGIIYILFPFESDQSAQIPRNQSGKLQNFHQSLPQIPETMATDSQNIFGTLFLSEGDG
jgi:hypothetical protein